LTDKSKILQSLKGKLIVSCQAQPGEPLCVRGYMAKMALAAKIGGASGIRAESIRDIEDIRKEVGLPIVGLWKVMTEGCNVYITPTIEEARAVYNAGAEIIAIDATNRKNREGFYAWELIKKIKADMPQALVMADISTIEEGINAEKQGADIVSTTLSGYTEETRHIKGIDFELISALVKSVKIPVVAEGRIHRPEDAAKALELGAHSVVVGGAITRPAQITSEYVKAVNNISK